MGANARRRREAKELERAYRTWRKAKAIATKSTPTRPYPAVVRPETLELLRRIEQARR